MDYIYKIPNSIETINIDEKQLRCFCCLRPVLIDELDFIINLHYNEAPEFYKIYKKHEIISAHKLLNKYNNDGEMPGQYLQFPSWSYFIKQPPNIILCEMQKIIKILLDTEELNFIDADEDIFNKQLKELHKSIIKETNSDNNSHQHGHNNSHEDNHNNSHEHGHNNSHEDNDNNSHEKDLHNSYEHSYN
tara:strand:- start:260 stop:829 length:570 start_codon:yes stop_codon:yes gene_type:complete